MSLHEQIKLFEEAHVRSVYDDVLEQWFFSIVDIIKILTDSDNPTDYLKKMRKRDTELGTFIGTNCPQILMTTATGLRRKTLAATPEQVFRIIQSIPSKKAEPFKQWIESISKEHDLQSADVSHNMLIYSAEDGTINLDVKIDGDTVGLSVQQMADLFGRDRTVISKHIANVYEEGELQRDITCAKFAHMIPRETSNRTGLYCPT